MKSKLLVLGGSGLVGSSFINSSKNDYDVIFSYNNNKAKKAKEGYRRSLRD